MDSLLLNSFPYFNATRYKIVIKSRFSNLFENLKVKEIISKYEAQKSTDEESPKKKKIPINIRDILIRKEHKTSVVIRNIPKNIKINDLLQVFKEKSIDGFNLICIPSKVSHNCGFALINFKDPKSIVDLYSKIHQKKFPGSDNVCEVIYSHVQGIKRIRKNYLSKFIYDFSKEVTIENPKIDKEVLLQ